jgi:hypothetical protein
VGRFFLVVYGPNLSFETCYNKKCKAEDTKVNRKNNILFGGTLLWQRQSLERKLLELAVTQSRMVAR